MPRNISNLCKTIAYRTVIRTHALVKWMLAPNVLVQLVVRHVTALIAMYLAYTLYLVHCGVFYL
jgi:hypothetical protein